MPGRAGLGRISRKLHKGTKLQVKIAKKKARARSRKWAFFKMMSVLWKTAQSRRY